MPASSHDATALWRGDHTRRRDLGTAGSPRKTIAWLAGLAADSMWRNAQRCPALRRALKAAVQAP
jgi:hypothetical protein